MSTASEKNNFENQLSYYKQIQPAEAVSHRLEGLLPIVDILDHPFIVDVKGGELLPKGNYSAEGLDLINGGWHDPHTNQHCFYYDTKHMKEARISPDITTLPKDVVLIKIPEMEALDPIGMAKKNKVDTSIYLKKYPQQMYHKAQVSALEQTVLLDVAKANKLAVKSPPKMGKRKIKYKNKGPGL
jgi:hypothetical protein